jgi:DNA-directed RNA polymerase subunit RPC12/RpoP
MRCAKCLREYRIRRSRIPKGASAVHCKVCGAKIRFPKPASAAARPPKHQNSTPSVNRPRFRLDVMTPEKRQTKKRFTRMHSRSTRQSGR